MEPLEGVLADLVAQEREALDAIDKPRDAAWSGIAAGWGAGPPPVPPPGAAEATATATKGGAIIKLVSAMAIGGAVAAAAWLGPGQDPAQGPEEERVVAPVVAELEPPVSSVRPPPENLPEIATPPPAPESRLEPEPVPKATNKPEPTLPQAGLSEELALVEALRRDVNAGRYADALKKAKRHRDEFPQGALRADRMDLEAAAQCGGGRVDAGRKTADQKAKRWPRAPVSDRLRTLCKLDER